jgi:hypothetical protein
VAQKKKGYLELVKASMWWFFILNLQLNGQFQMTSMIEMEEKGKGVLIKSALSI